MSVRKFHQGHVPGTRLGGIPLGFDLLYKNTYKETVQGEPDQLVRGGVVAWAALALRYLTSQVAM